MKKIFVLISLGFITLFSSFNVHAYIQLDEAILEFSNGDWVSTPDSNTNVYKLGMGYDLSTKYTYDLRTIVGYAWAIDSLNDIVYSIKVQSTMTLFYGSTEVFTLNPHLIVFNTGLTTATSYVQFISTDGSYILQQISYADIIGTSLPWEIHYQVQILNLDNYYLGFDNGYSLGYNEGYKLATDEAYQLGLEQGKIIGLEYNRQIYGYWDGSSWLTAEEHGLIEFNKGYQDGLEEQNPFGIYDMVGHGFNVLGAILDRDIWPGFKIGYLLYIPLGFSLLMFFLKFKKGS